MIGLFAISPTIIALLVMWCSAALGKPIQVEKVSWLIINAQLAFIVVSVILILLGKNQEASMPTWRLVANKWIGRAMATSVLLFMIAMIISVY